MYGKNNNKGKEGVSGCRQPARFEEKQRSI